MPFHLFTWKLLTRVTATPSPPVFSNQRVSGKILKWSLILNGLHRKSLRNKDLAPPMAPKTVGAASSTVLRRADLGNCLIQDIIVAWVGFDVSDGGHWLVVMNRIREELVIGSRFLVEWRYYVNGNLSLHFPSFISRKRRDV